MSGAYTIVNTEDGSITCFDKDTGELYHNRAGAFTEALKNYVELCGLDSVITSQVSIYLLDVCFGLGYNSFVFLNQLRQLLDATTTPDCHLDVRILAIDIDAKILEVIPTVLADPKFNKLINCLACESNKEISWIKESLSSCGTHKFRLKQNVRIEFELRLADIRQAIPELVKIEQSKFDFIFHDGFSPNKMPELWTIDLFHLYKQLIKQSGRIVTYSSATAIRGALKACGLEVKKTAPVGGKSGGTIAGHLGQIQSDKYIFELSDDEISRLSSRSSTPYRDPDFKDSRILILNRRQKEVAGK